MPVPKSADEILNREFLEIRARLLQVAAAFDRIDRAGDQAASDPRWGQIQRALATLSASQPGRAEEIQLIFSRPYQSQWRTEFGLTSDRS